MPDRLSILVVDDDQEKRELLCEVLEQNGYTAAAVPNGNHALNLLQSDLPSLILLDLLMPEKDGWQVLFALRSMSHSANVPVLVLSVVPRHQLEGAPIQGYLEKPFEIDDLLKEIRRLIG